MTARLSPQREAEIAARAEAAHPGPWRRSDDEGSLERYVLSEDDLFAISFGYRGNRTQAEADFVAHAREDVPALLAELAAVRAERDCLAMVVMFARQWGGGTPFELHKGIDEVLSTMPTTGVKDSTEAGETA